MNEIKSELLKVIGLLDQAQQTTFKQMQEDNYKHSKAQNDRIVELEAELDKISQELAKRPVVYCARNKITNRMLTLGGFVVLLYPAQRSDWEDAEWTTEIYTGEQLP